VKLSRRCFNLSRCKRFQCVALFVAGVVFATDFLKAQDLQLEQGAVGSYLRLKELRTTGSVLHVVAHPDDEDGAMLAYCSRGLGARTMLFSITRGEGGANLISSHFFDELGALRTLEHLKAASYYGIELFYSRAADYGYSKTLKEAMQQWNDGTAILEDLVEMIRRERPTVLLSRFAGDPRDGHGHHQMAGVISRLAFDAAADPTQFPEQLQRGYEPWQIKKLYVRAGPREDWTIAIPAGTYDPVIGRSYAQIARFGLGFQRST
jgi:LmbE family N-acetylglucosaminyl deacetylase